MYVPFATNNIEHTRRNICLIVFKSNQIWTVITPFQLTSPQTKFCFLPTQPEMSNYNPNLV